MHSATLVETPGLKVLDQPYRAMTVGVLALVSLLAFEAMAVTTAMPIVARQLNGISYYPLAFGGAMAASMLGMVLAGHRADREGPASPLWIGIAWFVLGLLIAGSAEHMLTVLVGRTVMGLGVGMQSVALYACVGRAYPPELHARIFGLFAAAWIVPSLVGPLLAGLIAESIGWRWLFLAAPLLVLPCVLLLAPGLRALPAAAQSHTPNQAWERRRVFLAVGAALAALLVHGSSQAQGAHSWVTALVALSLMVYLGQRLLPSGVLTLRRGLPSVIALRGLVAAAFATTEIYIPLLLVEQRGFSATQAGMVLTTGALAWSAGSWAQGRMPSTVPRGTIITAGTSCMAIGIALVGLQVLPSVPVWLGVCGLIATGFGIGMSFPQMSVLTLQLSPNHGQGSSVSALQLSDALTTTAAIAIAGALFTALLRVAPGQAYLANFGLAFVLAVISAWAGGRVGLGARAEG